ncbi:hypothetical protein V6N13_126167 [Hibiscus sabdariffa]|uniref:Uncharacterized protein n=2 Tax=Hibiscus sabdariffa TaxID=183260 RepID=A0ABR2AS04_9ROSI
MRKLELGFCKKGELSNECKLFEVNLETNWNVVVSNQPSYEANVTERSVKGDYEILGLSKGMIEAYEGMLANTINRYKTTTTKTCVTK